jgi:hypothetical protein
MDSLEKKLARLSPELYEEVSDFVDFLLLKMEKKGKSGSESDERASEKGSRFRFLKHESSTPAASNQSTNQSSSPTATQVPSKKSSGPAILGEREIDDSKELFPCPFCKCIVQSNWTECPFCNKPLVKKK